MSTEEEGNESDNAGVPPTSDTSDLPLNGTTVPVDRDLPPKARAHQERVARNVEGKAQGTKKLGTVNEDVDWVVDQEVLPYLSKKGMGPRDCLATVMRERPAGPSGRPVNLGTFQLDSCPTGAEVVGFVTETFHLSRPDKGPATYRVSFRTTHMGTFINDGMLQLDGHEEIMALRTAMMRARRGGGGGQFGSAPAYVPPQGLYPQSAYPQQPPPPPPPQQPQQQPQQQQQPGYYGDPHTAGEVAQLRVELAQVLGRVNTILGQPPPAAPPPAPTPITAQSIAEAVSAGVVAGLKAAGIGAAPPAPGPAPPPPPPRDAASQARDAGGTLGVIADVLIDAKRAFKKLEDNFTPNTNATAEPIPEGEGDEADDLPFRVIPIPGVKTKDGQQVNWAEDRKTERFHGMGFIASNSDIFGRWVEKGIDLAEKVVKANTTTIGGKDDE
jgi:hypothetical protein